MSRQIVLDTETTGLEPEEDHRIIEIGGVEIEGRRLTGRHFHEYVNPEREIDAGALEVHGITAEFLADKPRFADVAGALLEFVRGAELVIHNAPFDVGFLDSELARLDPSPGRVADYCTVIDTLALARQRHPGQKNSLDALCRRYAVDNSGRELHGALLDAEILADVYLAMSGGQTTFVLGEGTALGDPGGAQGGSWRRLPSGRPAVRVVRASETELAAHRERLAELDASAPAGSVWSRLEGAGEPG